MLGLLLASTVDEVHEVSSIDWLAACCLISLTLGCEGFEGLAAAVGGAGRVSHEGLGILVPAEPNARKFAAFVDWLLFALPDVNDGGMCSMQDVGRARGGGMPSRRGTAEADAGKLDDGKIAVFFLAMSAGSLSHKLGVESLRDDEKPDDVEPSVHFMLLLPVSAVLSAVVGGGGAGGCCLLPGAA